MKKPSKKVPPQPPAGLVRAGQSELVQKLAKKPPLTYYIDASAVDHPLMSTILKALTRAQEKLLDTAVQIAQEPDAFEMAYMARELVQCTLPHSDPGDNAVWMRRNGDLCLVIQRPVDRQTMQPIGFPYGSLPRLLLYWITSEAVRTKNRRLELGSNLTSFMTAIGLNPDGRGKRSDAKRLREQMMRLFRATISFEIDHRSPRQNGFGWLDMQIAPKGELWWDPKRPDQTALWGSWIELGEDFFRAITHAPVPVDLRALKALKKSPLALDLYGWATHKAYTAWKTGKPQFVPWVALSQQFGSDYSDPKDFRKKALAALRKIVAVYPGLKLEHAEGGIVVLPTSRPAIPARPANQ